MVARYNSGGSADNAFGTNGVVTTNLGSTWDQAEGVVVQSDNKIVVAGFTQSQTKGREFAVLVTIRMAPSTPASALAASSPPISTGSTIRLATYCCSLTAKSSSSAPPPPWPAAIPTLLWRAITPMAHSTTFGTGGKVTTNVGTFDTGQRARCNPTENHRGGRRRIYTHPLQPQRQPRPVVRHWWPGCQSRPIR